jgi:hypothetical protein
MVESSDQIKDVQSTTHGLLAAMDVVASFDQRG